MHKLDRIVCEGNYDLITFAVTRWYRTLNTHITRTQNVFTKKLLFSTLETRGTPCSTWTGSRRTAGRRLAATRRCGRGMVLSSSPSHHRILWIFSVLMIAAVTATVAQVRLLVFPGHTGALTDPVLSRSLSLCRGLGRSRLQC